MLLLLVTVTLTLPLCAAMVLAAQALLDCRKRNTALFLAPVLVSAGTPCQPMPAGLWHVYCLAALYHTCASSSEGCTWL